MILLGVLMFMWGYTLGEMTDAIVAGQNMWWIYLFSLVPLTIAGLLQLRHVQKHSKSWIR